MRLAAIALACLLAACTVPAENASTNAEWNEIAANSAAPAAPAAPAPGQPLGSRAAPQPSGEPNLSASPQQVARAATVTLALANGTSEPLGYNLCTSALLGSAGSPVRTDRVCTMELRTLEPGNTATYPYELPASVGPGSYRFSTSVERMRSGTRTAVTSNEITVR